MYQVISSAIVNMPPSEMAIRIAHMFKTKWDPVDNTEEEMIDFFEENPEMEENYFIKNCVQTEIGVISNNART